MTRIDAHQHFWELARGDYGWLTPEQSKIYHDFLPDDLAPLLARNGIEGTVLVQAAPTIEETKYLLGLASKHDFVKGVVGWVDFESSDAPKLISELAEAPMLVGLRPMIQDIDEVDWMLGTHLQPAFDAIVSNDLTFDALTLPKHLPNLAILLERLPQMRVVIDHASKPEIRNRKIDGWTEDMTRLARDTSCYCKISGLVTEATKTWSVPDLQPYVDHLLESFGTERLIWGSDWPVCTLAATYNEWVEATELLFERLSSDEVAAIMGGNTIRAYNLTGT